MEMFEWLWRLLGKQVPAPTPPPEVPAERRRVRRAVYHCLQCHQRAYGDVEHVCRVPGVLSCSTPSDTNTQFVFLSYETTRGKGVYASLHQDDPAGDVPPPADCSTP